MSTTRPPTWVEGLEMRALEMSEVRVFRSARREDRRGSVRPTCSKLLFASFGVNTDFVQENHCVSPRGGTIRGFLYQRPPYGQAKVIRVTRESMLDVSLDLRRGSPTLGRHVKAELSPDGWDQVLVPVGFGHWCPTLEDDTEVIFKLWHLFLPDYAAGLA